MPSDTFVEVFSARLESCRRQQEEIWAAFARTYDRKAQAVSYLVDLGLSLSEDQVVEMEQSEGFTANCLTEAQAMFLREAEPLALELGFLPPGRMLAESRFLFCGSGQLWFSWSDSHGNGYRPWFRRFFTFVVPLACMNFIPAGALWGRPEAAGIPPSSNGRPLRSACCSCS